MNKQIKITMQRDEQLSSSFMDMFSKFILHNGDTIADLQHNIPNEMIFPQLMEYLTNITKIRYNGSKSPNHKVNYKINFDFSSKNNHLTFLLDMSPHMMVYNFGTKTLPLKNMQEIIIYLLRRLAQRHTRNKQYQYHVTIHLYSLHSKKIQMIIQNQLINENSIDTLCEFINLTIQKSQLLHQQDAHRHSIADIIQQAFCQEEAKIGMRSLVVVSSFMEEQTQPLILFTPSWYTITFINTGGHFGSFVVQNQSLLQKLIPGVCFKTKYVFKAHFLENWQMTDFAKQADPSITKPITEKFRSIQFTHLNDSLCPDILDLILVFGIQFKHQRTHIGRGGAESVISNMKDSSSRLVFKSYSVPAENFFYILRTRYMQGWQPVFLSSSTMAVQNSKFRLRLPIQHKVYIFYEATRSKNLFQIIIYQLLKSQTGKEFHSRQDRFQLGMIQKMDKLNSYNFSSLMNKTLKLQQQSSRKNTFMNVFLQSDKNSQNQMVGFICNTKDWGKFFKQRKLCFRFQPHLISPSLQEFKGQTQSIIGPHLINNIHLRQTENQQRGFEKVDDAQAASSRKVMLTKINSHGDVLQLQMAFLRYSSKEINDTLQLLSYKITHHKLKKNITVTSLPYQISLFHKGDSHCNHLLFNKKWTLKFKSNHYIKLFRIYWQSTLKKTNYIPVFAKHDAHYKRYYKIIDVKTQQQNKQISTFLCTRQTLQKNQILFHLSTPPSFTTLLPFNKEEGVKPIYIPQLINLIALGLKNIQKEIIRLVDTYQTIHHKLLQMALVSSPKAINLSVLSQILTLYQFRAYTSTLPINFEWSCRQLIDKYYHQHKKQQYHILPIPSNLLMSTDLAHISGDINITLADKEYSLFLCSPFKFIYLQKRQKSLYYKFVNLHYQEFNPNENEPCFLEPILNEIILRINQQIYIRDFKTFLEGDFKGDTSKIINNQQFTHLEEKQINVSNIFNHCQKFYVTVIQPHSVEEKRIRKTLEDFAEKLTIVLRQFFPAKRAEYYFQTNRQPSLVPFGIDTDISRSESQLFMRMLFDAGQAVDIDPMQLPDCIIKNYQSLIRNSAFFTLKFYMAVNNKNQKTLLFTTTLTELINNLCLQISHQMQRSLITKSDTLHYMFQNFSFLWQGNQPKEVRLSLIKMNSQKIQTLCGNIEHQVMQNIISFQRVRPVYPDYMIVQEQKSGVIQVKQPFMMRVSRGRLEFHYHHSSRFFRDQQYAFRHKIQGQYISGLSNFINANVLMNELISTYQLPWEPYQLWMNQTVNQHRIKNFSNNSKKITKRNQPAVSKFLTKKAPKSKDKQEVPLEPSQNSSTPKITLKRIIRNYIPLNDRTPSKTLLIYLLEDQILSLCIVHNMKHLYLFQRFIGNDHVIIFFEEQQDQSRIKQISEQNKQRIYPKCKSYLVYSAFSLNSLLDPKVVDNKIKPRINDVINKQLFDEVAKSLLVSPHLIPQFEQNFIKKHEPQQRKQIKFQIPSIFHKDHLIQYIIQHLQIYHFRVQFKSQIEKNEKQKAQSVGQNRFIESIKFVEPARYQTKSELFTMEPSSLDKKFSEQVQHYSLSVFSGIQKKSMLENSSASITNSNLKTSQILQENQSQTLYEICQYNWLYNCQKPDQFLSQKYGACLYILKIKHRDQPLKVPQRDCHSINKVNYLFTRIQNNHESLQNLKPFAFKRPGKNKRDSFSSRSMLVFQIGQYTGKPNFAMIEDTFFFITKACVGQTYLENLLYKMYSDIMRNFSSLKEQRRKEIDKESKSIFKQIVYPALFNIRHQFQQIITQLEGFLFFKYISNSHLLVNDKGYYFQHFLNQFSAIINLFRRSFGHQAQLKIEVLFYGQTQQNQNIFIEGDLGTLKVFVEEIQVVFKTHKFSKLGFMCSDYISVIRNSLMPSSAKKSTTKRDSSCLKPIVTLKDLQIFKDYEYVSDYHFKRSTLIFYQITDSQFIYGSYNIKTQIDTQIKDYLSAMDCWLNQKSKMYSLIKNIKDNGIYEWNIKQTQRSSNVDPFYTLRKKQYNQSQEKMMAKDISLYRLMVNIIFKDLPEIIEKQDKNKQNNNHIEKNQQNKTSVIPDESIIHKKYAHHHSQTQTLFKILKETSVNYSKYPPYKGTQRYPSQRLGFEYVSILRQLYQTCQI